MFDLRASAEALHTHSNTRFPRKTSQITFVDNFIANPINEVKNGSFFWGGALTLGKPEKNANYKCKQLYCTPLLSIWPTGSPTKWLSSEALFRSSGNQLLSVGARQLEIRLNLDRTAKFERSVNETPQHTRWMAQRVTVATLSRSEIPPHFASTPLLVFF